MKHPVIENDPITMVAEAFADLYPDARYEAAYAPTITDGHGTVVCSCITFEEDGPIILLNSQAGVEVVAEAFAQELTHVALGPDSLEHGPEYDKAYDALAERYKEIAEERFPAQEGGDRNE